MLIWTLSSFQFVSGLEVVLSAFYIHELPPSLSVCAQRTLFVVEAMLKSDIPEVFSQMDLILQELHSLTTSTNTTIRAKAKKVAGNIFELHFIVNKF